MFFQMHSAPQVPTRAGQRAQKPCTATGSSTPTWVKERPQFSPLMLYSWEQTLGRAATRCATTTAALRRHRARVHAPADRRPGDADHVAAASRCCGQGEELKRIATPAARCSTSCRARAQTIIDGKTFDWAKGDIIALPSWALHEHANTGERGRDPVLDPGRPVLKALGLFYEEEFTENSGHQKITSAFSPV